MTTVTTAKALAEALCVSAPRVCQLRKFSWFPSGPPWDPVAVRSAIEKNRRRASRKSPSQAAPRKPGKKASPKAGRPCDPLPQTLYPPEILSVLEDPESTAVAIGTAAVRLAAIRFAAGLRDSRVASSQDLAQLKQAMEELRRARSDYLDLGVKQGDLIQRASAKELAGRIVQVVLRITANIEALLPPQVEVWGATQEFTGSRQEQRRATVTKWVRGLTSDLRGIGADELEQMLSEIA